MSNGTSVRKLTQKRLKELFVYDEFSGKFSRIVSIVGSSIDRPVGHKDKSNGYITVRVDGKKYYAHRLAWLYVNGYTTENEIDHINRDRTDNRIGNLREATRTCNSRNCSIKNCNTSGINGVGFSKGRNKWVASIMVNYKNIYIGRYNLKIDAAYARWNAEVKYNFPTCNTTSSAYQYLKEHDKNFKG